MNDRVDAENVVDAADEKASNRRKFLMLGGGAAAAIAATAASVAAPGRASAANGNSIIIGSLTNSGTSSTELTMTAGGPTLWGDNQSTTLGGIGVEGSALGGTGVYGVGTAQGATFAATGIHAVGAGSALATAALVDNQVGGLGLHVTTSSGPLALLTQTTGPSPMPPTSGAWTAGTVIQKGGHLWYCYISGTGTASKWAKLSGGLVVFPAANRAYDSRATGGPLAAGQTRTVNLSTAGGVPAGATGALVNLTVTETSGAGYLTIFAAGLAFPGTSNINWSASGQTLANNATSGMDGSAQVSVFCGGGQTQFIIDVAGYYP